MNYRNVLITVPRLIRKKNEFTLWILLQFLPTKTLLNIMNEFNIIKQN